MMMTRADTQLLIAAKRALDYFDALTKGHLGPRSQYDDILTGRQLHDAIQAVEAEQADQFVATGSDPRRV